MHTNQIGKGQKNPEKERQWRNTEQDALFPISKFAEQRVDLAGETKRQYKLQSEKKSKLEKKTNQARTEALENYQSENRTPAARTSEEVHYPI